TRPPFLFFGGKPPQPPGREAASRFAQSGTVGDRTQAAWRRDNRVRGAWASGRLGATSVFKGGHE
ncbi:MAG: hypothetical protein O3A76_07845, partial [Chloroflexi bacterium]|nr:hypothetical protein [Chloroflexota bacterium]